MKQSKTNNPPRRTILQRLGLNTGIVLVLALLTTRAGAFSLLGPYAPWMDITNGYRLAYDIGGPVDIHEEYRWNVPVVTYGFDKSFLDYFGSKGVNAVEQAIQILNDLPPASRIVLTNYSLDSLRANYLAPNLGVDIKSMTLSLLVEQLGLGSPTRNVFDLRRWDSWFLDCFLTNRWDWEGYWGSVIPDYIIERNFDPVTLAMSQYVNDVFYCGYVNFRDLPGGEQTYYMQEFTSDPFVLPWNAVSDGLLYSPLDFFTLMWWGNAGIQPFLDYTGLTRDDVGGLRYLYSTNNVNYEKLPPGVRRSDANHHLFVNGAWRPGVEKIKFVPHPFDYHSGQFRPVRNQFTDTYIVNGIAMKQPVERLINQPDFLFCAADTGEHNSRAPWYVCTDTTNWMNNAALNGSATNAGPGVIQPPITITFHKLGTCVYTGDYDTPGDYCNYCWCSFDSSTNLPVVYPYGRQRENQLTVRLRFCSDSGIQLTNQTWHLRVPIGGQAALQISTDQSNWSSLGEVTNAGAVIEWNHYESPEPQKFFRVVPE